MRRHSELVTKHQDALATSKCMNVVAQAELSSEREQQQLIVQQLRGEREKVIFLESQHRDLSEESLRIAGQRAELGAVRHQVQRLTHDRQQCLERPAMASVQSAPEITSEELPIVGTPKFARFATSGIATSGVGTSGMSPLNAWTLTSSDREAHTIGGSCNGIGRRNGNGIADYASSTFISNAPLSAQGRLGPFPASAPSSVLPLQVHRRVEVGQYPRSRSVSPHESSMASSCISTVPVQQHLPTFSQPVLVPSTPLAPAYPPFVSSAFVGFPSPQAAI